MPARRIASRYTAGSGLPARTSALETAAANEPPSPMPSMTTSITSLGADVASATGPLAAASATSSSAPAASGTSPARYAATTEPMTASVASSGSWLVRSARYRPHSGTLIPWQARVSAAVHVPAWRAA